jgi:hypothetical protein
VTERRQSPRGRALKGAKIAFNQKSSVMDCTVRNLTEKGALLKFASTVGIPERFDIMLDTERAYRPCKVVWRRDDSLGIEFA